MSLDVYLKLPGVRRDIAAGPRIFIRDGGQNVEISRGEWDRRNPGREPVTFEGSSDEEVFSAYITHNLGAMAREAGIYECLWRPDEHGITHARQLIEPLAKGLALLRSDPERFKRLNPANGWGTYEGFAPWVERYLEACREFPDAEVSVWR